MPLMPAAWLRFAAAITPCRAAMMLHYRRYSKIFRYFRQLIFRHYADAALLITRLRMMRFAMPL